MNKLSIFSQFSASYTTSIKRTILSYRPINSQASGHPIKAYSRSVCKSRNNNQPHWGEIKSFSATSIANMPNRLQYSKNPYLLQHKDNPVDWYEWCEEAFAKAQKENKCIFLSVGYSTCHWCHVMEHETFEDDEAAKVVNESFVNIKVDREERPDVDKVYMAFVTASHGHGGWPMSVWLTPNLKPIYGATYFQKEDFLHLCKRVKELWDTEGRELEKQGEDVFNQLEKLNNQKDTRIARIVTWSAPKTLFTHFTKTFDPKNGGFSSQPKFPTVSQLIFLLRYHVLAKPPPNLDLSSLRMATFKSFAEKFDVNVLGITEKSEFIQALEKGIAARSTETQRALQMVELTLQKMAHGGIHDHVGFGFHRYSTDDHWHVPHFEKMLYDQAQLLQIYAEAYSITKNPLYKDTAYDILKYVDSNLTSPQGGFYCAEDADSLPNATATHRKEGAFAVWTSAEINESLHLDAALFSHYYGVKEQGNCPPDKDPHGELKSQNILYVADSIESTAARFGKSVEEAKEILQKCLSILASRRRTRPPPRLDDKILVAWNGLYIGALARASQLFSDTTLSDRALRAIDFIRSVMIVDGVLMRSYRDGLSNVKACVDDYAYFIQALLDTYEATFDDKLLELAYQLQDQQDQKLWDSDVGGYYNAETDPNLSLRMKDDQDGAEPSPNSV
ncbi:hypothetical protein SeLEV6574_g06399 [Synchytrium endobioticum]|nr:hypothetical protein SeLEV6574_g06399 [Synchytrium endobioticum]